MEVKMGAARVRGLVFLGFPLHPAGKPSVDRAQHLREIAIPMLFVGGTRDALADPTLLDAALQPLGDRATLFAVADADHSFHVPARSGGNDAAVLVRILDEVASWIIARA